MLNIALVSIISLALLTSLVVGVYALFRSQSYKKNHFLLMHLMVIIYLFGHLLELTSSNADEAYTAIKIMYLGGYMVPVFTLFFITDYCNIKVSNYLIKAPMLLISSGIVLTMWTTKYHGMIYSEYGFSTVGYRVLTFTPGPLYSILHMYPTICMAIVMGIILHQLRKWRNKYRQQLLLLLLCLSIPFLGETIYFISVITGLNKAQINSTPLFMAIMSFCLYLSVMRYNIFEVISIATITAMDHIREGFVLVDEKNNYLSANPAAIKILPGITSLIKGESILAATDWPEELRNLGNDSAEFSTVRESTKYFRASVSPVITQGKTVMAKIILFSEITDNVNLMRELENAAYIDSLTGLYNRKHFSELAVVDIERSLRLNQSIYMVMLDLDFFKNVNDTHGHAAGDIVLKATAGIIRQTIRSYDLIGRYGGEEFILLLTAVDATEAHRLMERIRENMEHSIINYEGIEINITCSIGLARFLETDTLESSVKKADDALYAAKNAGRNKVMAFGEY